MPAEIHPYDVTVEAPASAEAYDCKWGARGISADVLHQLDDARANAATEGQRLLPVLVVFDARRSCEVRIARHTAPRAGTRLVTIETLDRLAGRRAEAAAPLLGVADTLRRKAGAHYPNVPRDGLFRAPTPPGVRFAAILAAHRKFAGEKVTDDFALAERAGLSTVAVAGEEMNLKLTTAEDFALAERLAASALPDIRTGNHRAVDVNRVARVWYEDDVPSVKRGEREVRNAFF